MSNWALIVNDVVFETTDIDPADRFSPDMVWVECAASVEPGYNFIDGNFVAQGVDLAQAKLERIASLRAACEAAIIGGFTSHALGANHVYPSDIKAQINLMGSVTDSLLPSLPPDWQTPFWVCNEDGIWSFKMHQASQIQQAGRDGKVHVVACQATLEELTSRVDVASSIDDVEAIVWPA
ncbi:DUF4376 domain-containing protein [Agrobacterium tumefaciens]|uniref:DUF4376 domain-containing protein n=1 Tax=Agrobacterium tumefaciens TaxID=358 RepID=UPI000EF18E85|nr:hypothetical protein At1D1108_34280 [Agrobacterium tumefaciens]NSY94076.1 DUF4376 domain-containing protein [Agrobacterium tumefaciens]